MIENEVKIYDSKIEMRPIDAEIMNPANAASPPQKIDITFSLEQFSGSQTIRFTKKRKVRKTKSAGIF